MKPAVFLDRDNTLIHNDEDLGDPDAVRLIQGAASAVSSLCGLGYRTVVVTNQGGVARGKYTEADVDAVHQRLRELIEKHANGARIDAFYYCPYHPEAPVEQYRQDDHPDRKPNPGMLLAAAKDLDIDLKQSWMIGDHMRDVAAGVNAGTRTILLRANAGPIEPLTPDRFEETDEKGRTIRPDFVARSLIEAVRVVAQQRKPESAEDIQRGVKPPPKRLDFDALGKPRPKPGTPSAAAEPREAAGSDADDAGKAPAASEKAPEPPRASSGSAAEEGAERKPPHRPEPIALERRAEQRGEARPADTAAHAERAPSHDEPESQPVDSNEPGRLDRSVRQLVQELRNQREMQGELGPPAMIALVLQFIALICLLGGLLMGADDTGLFLRWMGPALLAQLAAITALLFRR